VLLRTVGDINEAVREETGPDVVLTRVARGAKELLGAAACAVLTIAAGDVLLVRTVDGALLRGLWGTWVSGRDTPEGEAIRTRRPVSVPGDDGPIRRVSPLARPGVRSALVVPVPGWGRPVGLVELVDDHDRRFTAEDIRTVGLVVAHAGFDVERSWTFTALNRLGSALGSGERSLPDTLDGLAGCLVETGGAVAAAQYVVGDDGSLRLMARQGLSGGRTGTWHGISSHGVPAGAHAARRTRSEVIDAGLVCLPLLSDDSVLGVLCGHFLGDSRPTGLELAYMSLVAAQSAAAVEASRRRAAAAGKAVTAERRRLARELHDSVSQALYSIGLGARTVGELLDRDPAQAHQPVDYILQLAEAGLAELRALIFELRPEGLAEEGLVAALDKQIAAVGVRHGLDTLAVLGPEPPVSLDIKRSLYRIALEVLQNVVRHAHAGRVTARMELGAADLVLEIGDDGVGFDPGASFPGHLGLASMRERIGAIGGELDISSAPGAGTRVRARAPLDRGTGG
jgi:signal transduction histidine kinase